MKIYAREGSEFRWYTTNDPKFGVPTALLAVSREGYTYPFDTRGNAVERIADLKEGGFPVGFLSGKFDLPADAVEVKP